jgi:hypothetical protein
MAKRLESELDTFADDSLESKLFVRKPSPEDTSELHSQEWFRAHPQLTTDRLIKLGSLLD